MYYFIKINGMLKIITILISLNISNLYSQTNFIDKLTRNDTLKIVCEIDGCEVHSKETISIYKSSDTLFANLNMDFNDDIKYQKLTSVLSNTSVVAYAEFEEKLRKYTNSRHGCTSIAEYRISLKTENVELKDKGCEFRDYEILKEKLFGKVTIENYNKKIYR